MTGTSKFCTYLKQFFLSLIALASFCFSNAQNPIVTENTLPGNPSSEWDIAGAGDLTIQGFATDISVNRGQTIRFKINTDAVNYTIDIYRLGYYNGNGARHIGAGVITATLPQTQPSPLTDATTGLVDCGNWNESAHWDVPATAVSGIYIALLKRTDNGGTSHIVFIVRDDASHADLFFQASDATWQAYNVYGGNSLYVGTTSLPNGHASKVSYNRPFLTRNGGGGGGVAQDWLFNAEYPMIRFLEKNGYDITYTTDIDAARYGSLILNHKVFMSVGHDEYWSAEQRSNVEAARDAGVHLAFFSGNEIYWKTRWENSTDASNAPYRTLVCYKEGTLGENVCGTKCDPSPEWTGLWRDGCNYPSAGGCRPENALSGQISWQNTSGSIQVPGAYKNLRFWRNTSIAGLSTEDIATFPDGTLGHEWNWEQFPDSYPHGRITMSSTTIGGYTHKLSLYRHSGGALVFGAGTIQWAWGLDDTHDRGNQPPSQDMQQATVNLFADMGVQPATLQSGLVPATQSTDTQTPFTLITSPSNGASFPAFAPITISGTSTDANVVVGVEVSVDGGITWKPASGTADWTFSWTPATLGPVSIKVRGFDDSGNMETPGSAPAPDAIIINITAPQCPCTLYQPTDTAANTNAFDNVAGVELGVKFQSSLSGYIKGLRFYKSSNDTGSHTGSLWTLNGTLIAQATFFNESASGWQEVLFSSPVAISANTTYVASYNSPTGYYSVTNPFFTSDFTNGPLTAIAKTHPDGPNGVYKYSTSPVFPDQNAQSENYWVGVVFDINAIDVSPPGVISTSPANNAIGASITGPVNVNFNEAIDTGTINNSTFELRSFTNAIVPLTMSYNYGSHRAILTPVSPLSYSSPYTLTIKGGTEGVKDISGNPLAADVSLTFTTLDASPLSPNQGPGGPILVISNSTNPFSLYPAEILRAEGLNEFAVMDISAVTSAVLNNYDVVILGEMTVNAAQVTLLTNWVTAGGTLIAFKPSPLLTPLLGISAPGGTLSDKYLLVNTASGPGMGIVNQTIQFHGTANLYTLTGATSLATLYSDATTATANPAVTSMNVGVSGGKAIAFTYDLAKSIIYTRQGNPAWAGTKRDGQAGPIRSDDMFFGVPAGSGADWVDFTKIAIPQADEQQRLLANIIIQNNLHRKPLPRFWYLPRSLKAAIVMTGDDHGVNGTTGRFNQYLTLGPNTAQDVANWTAIRGTSYIYPNTPISDAQIVSFQNKGFEIALHPTTTCGNFTQATLETVIAGQLGSFTTNFPGASAPVTNRTHCLPWSDWATHPKVELNHGMRLDVNYYYWPGSWIQNRPGMFTGSGMPMRFADLDGSMIDVYQATTQMTDESGIGVGDFCNAVLDKAIGAEGYYGVFTANMHTDTANHTGSNAIIASALAHQVPVISAKQMLNWIDGRNNSSFGSISWAGNVLSFTVTAASGSTNLRAMLPYSSGTDLLTQITRTGSSIGFTVSTIKGIQYAFFDASVTGNYTATYGPTTTLTGQVTLQGRPAAPNAQWQVPLVIELYITGNPKPVTTFTTTTNTSGQFTVSGLPVGTYNIAVKNSHTLRRIKLAQTLVLSGNNIDFGTLLEGDVNNDNYVTLIDLSLIIDSFNKALGDLGFDSRADLNNDGYVTLIDLSLLIDNFNQSGENNP
jgi:hypothetical protein